MDIWYTLVFLPHAEEQVQEMLKQFACTFHPACPTYTAAGFRHSTFQTSNPDAPERFIKATRQGTLRKFEMSNVSMWSHTMEEETHA